MDLPTAITGCQAACPPQKLPTSRSELQEPPNTAKSQAKWRETHRGNRTGGSALRAEWSVLCHSALANPGPGAPSREAKVQIPHSLLPALAVVMAVMANSLQQLSSFLSQPGLVGGPGSTCRASHSSWGGGMLDFKISNFFF